MCAVMCRGRGGVEIHTHIFPQSAVLTSSSVSSSELKLPGSFLSSLAHECIPCSFLYFLTLNSAQLMAIEWQYLKKSSIYPIEGLSFHTSKQPPEIADASFRRPILGSQFYSTVVLKRKIDMQQSSSEFPRKRKWNVLLKFNRNQDCFILYSLHA